MIVHLKRKAPQTHWYLKQAHHISCKPVVILKYCVTPFGFTDFEKNPKNKQKNKTALIPSCTPAVPTTHLFYSRTGKNSTNTLSFSVFRLKSPP